MDNIYSTYESFIAGLVSEAGYTPYTCAKSDTKPRVRSSTAAIIYPTSTTKKEGVVRGRISSTIEFVLLRNATAIPMVEPSVLWSGLTEDAVAIVDRLITSNIVLEVEGLTIEPATSRITFSDEAAVEVTVKVVSNFDLNDMV